VNDVRGRTCEGLRSARDPGEIRAKPEVDLSLEDVERVRVLPVDVWVRTLLAGLVAKERDNQLLELAEDRDRPLGAVGRRFAFAGS